MGAEVLAVSDFRRMQLHIERGQYRRVEAIARREGRSMADVIREFIEAGLEERERGRAVRLAALERMRERRARLPQVDVPGAREAVREERDRELQR